MSELNSLGSLRATKVAIINSDADFEDALDDALNCHTIDPQRPTKTHKEYQN